MGVMDARNLSGHVARQARLTNSQAADAVDAYGKVIVQQVQNGHRVEIDGFGLFEMAKREDGSQAIRFRQANKVKEVLNES